MHKLHIGYTSTSFVDRPVSDESRAADLQSMASTFGCRINMLDVEPTTKVLGFLGKTSSTGELVQAKCRWNDFART
ncbi:MAG: hypothetical protein NXH81_13025 [Halieaceae bacterium]|uniref:hypothetical protein n=1 Tax=Haliea alexandrii TaxID=2448162 RepID=UPI001304A3D3|nr:hypothetical protein [Haliea alexandrii]MCR9186315.1 hypothetical protein [Halieaceae bacterium]